jgi:two-component system sensor histidine kinase FlrB
VPPLPVSRRSLQAVLVELLGNAVRAAAGRPLRVEVGGRRTPAGVEWWVTDDGRGLPPALQGCLFAPFATGGGVGLGLFLVRQAAAAWGGAVRVRSEPGAGTTVTLLVRGP